MSKELDGLATDHDNRQLCGWEIIIYKGFSFVFEDGCQYLITHYIYLKAKRNRYHIYPYTFMTLVYKIDHNVLKQHALEILKKHNV